MIPPPKFDNPEEALRATKLLKRAGGVPRDHQDVADVPTTASEALLPAPSQLDPEWAWFFPALLYTAVGLDKSIFQLLAHAAEKTIPVRTYQAAEHIAKFEHAVADANPWMSVVQGIPKEFEQAAREFMESFVFSRKIHPVMDMSVKASLTRIADPFKWGTSRTGVDVYFLLPYAVGGGKQIVIRSASGLALTTPLLAVR